MNNLLGNPAFVAYAITCLVLSINVLFLWAYSGFVRYQSKTVMNEEDAARYGLPRAETDPPAVARVLRVHANAEAAVYPFLVLGLVFVLAGGGARTGAIIFGIFTAARVLHSICYLRHMQPWRTNFFTLGFLATLALVVAIIWLLIRGA